MFKIYTPDSWYSYFKTPSLIVADDGLIYAEDQYHSIGKTAIGKFDYRSGYIYGEDYSRLTRSAIGAIRNSGNITKIFGSDYADIFASPIFYIRDNKIYSAEEFFKVFPKESGYIESTTTKNNPAHKKEESDKKQKTSTGETYGKGKLALLIIFACILSVATSYLAFTDEEYFLPLILCLVGGCLLGALLARSWKSTVILSDIFAALAMFAYDYFTSASDYDNTSRIVAMIFAPFLNMFIFAGPAIILGSILYLIKKLTNKNKDKTDKKQ